MQDYRFIYPVALEVALATVTYLKKNPKKPKTTL